MRATAAGLVLAACALAGCTADAAPAPSASSTPSVTEVAAPSATPTLTPSPSSEPAPRLAWGPLESEWDDALAEARALTVAQAAGQVIVADLYSPEPAAAAALVDRWHLGGVILMGGSVTDAEGVRALAAAVQEAAPGDWPVLVSGDEEGGVVSRLSAAVQGMPAFMAAGAASDKAAVTAAYTGLGADLATLGVTVDFAPVADVTIGTSDPVIRSRSAGSDPHNVVATVDAAVAGLIAGGVAPAIKHFPGHGSVTVDSHHALPVQKASLEALEARDLVPFAAAIEAGAPAVMMGHIAVPAWGDDSATLEPAAYAYLREDLGFTGVAITDALNMGAITARHPAGEAAVQALRAGADLLLMPVSIEEAVSDIEAAVADGTLDRARLDQAAARSILLARWQAGLAGTAGAGDMYARDLAAAGAVVASAHCGAPWVEGEARVVAGGDDARRALAAALERRGVAVGSGGPSIALVGSGSVAATADIVVSLGEPWGLGGSDANTYVGLFGSSRFALAGLADVLTGAVEPAGQWPVEMDGLPATC